MIREIFLVLALASPLAALDQGGQPSDQQPPQIPSPSDKDLCSYLKDIEAKTDADCGQDALTALRSQDPAIYSQKLELARKRKPAVLKAYKFLKAPPSQEADGRKNTEPGNDPKLRHDQEAAPIVGKPDQAAPTQLQPPINERTFPAWLGAEEKDLKEVYTRLLQAQSQELQQEKESPVSLERGNEIDAALAANQAKITALGNINDPEAFICFLGEACGTRSELSDTSVRGAATSKGEWTKANPRTRLAAEVFLPSTADDSRLPVKLPVKVSAPKPVPSLAAGPKKTPGSKSENLPLWPLGAGAGLAAIGYGVKRSKASWAEQDTQATEEEDPNSARIQQNRYKFKAAAAAAAIGFGIVYGGPWVVGTAGPATVKVMRDAGGSFQRIATSQAGAVFPEEQLAGQRSAAIRIASAPGIPSARVASRFFEGTRYTPKVLNQMEGNDFHAFPEMIKNYAESGQVTSIKGADGVTRLMLRIPGSYQGRQGAFEFIKESDGIINHRIFIPD